MMPLHALHAIEKLLRDLTNEDIPFGGKIFLLGGCEVTVQCCSSAD